MAVTDNAAHLADDKPVDDDSDGHLSVGSRVRIHPGTDTESRGTVAEDFGENAGAAVNVGTASSNRPVAGPSSATSPR